MLHLKWMQYEMESTRTMVEHLWTIGAMVWDIKAAKWKISEEEQVLNVVRALPSEPEHWKNIKLTMTHSKHLKTFAEIQSHLKME